jgi:hypothetical protein
LEKFRKGNEQLERAYARSKVLQETEERKKGEGIPEQTEIVAQVNQKEYILVAMCNVCGIIRDAAEIESICPCSEYTSVCKATGRTVMIEIPHQKNAFLAD